MNQKLMACIIIAVCVGMGASISMYASTQDSKYFMLSAGLMLLAAALIAIFGRMKK